MQGIFFNTLRTVVHGHLMVLDHERYTMLRCASADLDTQLMQLKHCDGANKAITKMPYYEKESIVVILCFMSRCPLLCLLSNSKIWNT